MQLIAALGSAILIIAYGIQQCSAPPLILEAVVSGVAYAFHTSEDVKYYETNSISEQQGE
jgi:hypothetical protein